MYILKHENVYKDLIILFSTMEQTDLNQTESFPTVRPGETTPAPAETEQHKAVAIPLDQVDLKSIKAVGSEGGGEEMKEKIRSYDKLL